MDPNTPKIYFVGCSLIPGLYHARFPPPEAHPMLYYMGDRGINHGMFNGQGVSDGLPHGISNGLVDPTEPTMGCPMVHATGQAMVYFGVCP